VQSVHLAKGRMLADVGASVPHVFFPLNGMIALFATTEDADDIAVALVGADGLIGVPPVLAAHASAYAAVVEIPCDAYRLPSETLRGEIGREEDLHDTCLAFVDSLFAHVVQSALCHSHHALSRRLCRWLLTTRDCVRADTIDLTQESIAQMLGVTRPKLSIALAALEDQQLVRQRHGHIRIVNAPGLEACSCECYRVLRDQTRLSSQRRMTTHRAP
jgi:CRP-like cAMP-binding protein